MPDETDQNAFSEMLRITVDVGGFQAELGKLKTAYQDFISDLSKLEAPTVALAGGGDISGALSTIKSQISELADTVNTTFGARMEELEGRLAEALGGVGEAASSASQKQISAASMSYEAQAAFFKGIQEGGQAAYDALSAADQKWFIDFSKRAAQGAEDWVAYERKKTEATEKAAKQRSDVNKTLDDESTSDFTRKREARLAVEKKIEADLLALRKQNSAENKKLDSESEADFIRRREARLAVERKLEADLLAIKKERSAANKSADDETTTEFTRNYFSRMTVAERFEAALVRAHEEAQTKLKTRETETTEDFVKQIQTRREVFEKALGQQTGQQKKEANEPGVRTSFIQGLTGKQDISGITSVGTLLEAMGNNMLKITVSMASWLVAWKVAQDLIQTAVDIISFIPKHLEAGIAALKQDEQAAISLQGVIAQTTRLSGDFVQNFKEAGVASVQVVEQLRQKSAELGLQFDNVKDTYTFLSEAGGPALTRNLQEMVNLTVLLQLSMRGVTRNQEEERKIAQELPALLSGHATAQSRFLNLVKMTADEWNGIVDNAKSTQDLLDVLSVKLATFAEAGKLEKDSFAALEAQFANFVRMLDEALAKPFFHELIEWGKSFNALLEQHKVAIFAFVSLVGQVVSGVIRVTVEWLKVFSIVEGFAPVLRGIVALIVLWLKGISDNVEATILLLKLTEAVLTLDWAKGKAAIEEHTKAVNASNKAFKELFTGVKDVNGEVNELTKSTAGSPLPMVNEAKLTKEALQELTEKIREVRSDFSELRNDLKNQEELRVISRKAAEKQIIASYDNEITAIQNLISAQIIAASSGLGEFKGISKEQRDKTVKDLQAKEQLLIRGVDTEKLHENERLASDHLTRIEQAYRKSYNEIVKSNKAAFDAIDFNEKTNTISVETATNQRIALYKKQYDELAALIEKTKAQVGGERATTKGQGLISQLDEAQENAAEVVNHAVTGQQAQAMEAQQRLVEQHIKSMTALLRQGAAEQIKAEDDRIKAGRVSETAGAAFKLATEIQLQQRLAQIYQAAANSSNISATKREEYITLAIEAQHKYEAALASEPDVMQAAARRAEEIEARETARRAARMARLIEDTAKEKALHLEVAEVFARTATAKFQAEQKVLQVQMQAVDAAIRIRREELASAQQRQSAAAARGVDLATTEKLTNETLRLADALQREIDKRKALDIAELKNAASFDRGLGNENLPTARKALQNQVNFDQDKLADDTARLQQAFQDLINKVPGAAQRVTEHAKQVYEDTQALAGHTAELDASKPGIGQGVKDAGQSLDESLFGGNIKGMMDALGERDWGQLISSFGGAISKGIKSIGAVIQQFNQAKEKGGMLGGIGSLLSEGPTGEAIGKIPIAGPIINAAGSVMELLGGIFEAKAKKIAADIKKDTEDIQRAFSLGEIGLSQEIQQLEAERAKSIAELSSTKGGQDQLNKILPELDKLIEAAKIAQSKLLISFVQNVKVLREQNTELGTTLQTIQQIAKDAQDALANGSSKAMVQEFINLSLLKVKKAAQDEFLQGELTAIQDAIKLNDLTQQRIDLIKQEKQSEFDLLTKDADKRRLPQAIAIGQELAKQREAFQKQLTDLNSQIKVQADKVVAEKTIYTITGDIAALHRQDEQLQDYFMNQQIQKLLIAKEIMSGIVVNAKGNFSFDQRLASLLGIGLGQLNPNLKGQSVIPQGPISGANVYNPATNPYGPGYGKLVTTANAVSINNSLPGLTVQTQLAPMVDFLKTQINPNVVALNTSIAGLTARLGAIPKFSGLPAIGSTSHYNNIVINLTAHTNATAQSIANTVGSELQRRLRQGSSY